VSTYFTTQAQTFSKLCTGTPAHRNPLSNKKAPWLGLIAGFDGGAARSRTGLAGFAIRYITALLPRRILSAIGFGQWPRRSFINPNEKGQHFEVLPFELEREKSLELSTSTLARLRSTN
jgi:hypothetical protein